jgi:archaellum component FlaC
MAVSSSNLPLSKTKAEMESSVEMTKIRQDLDMLVMLYQRLVDRMIPVEDATPEEKTAIESKDEVFCRSDLDKALE